MSIFKWIGILSIAAGCIGVGIDWTSALRVRISTLRAMEQSLHLFRGFTETYRLPLGMVCQKISEQLFSFHLLHIVILAYLYVIYLNIIINN